MQTACMTWQCQRTHLHQELHISACVRTPTAVRRNKDARPSVTEVKPSLEKQLSLQKPSFRDTLVSGGTPFPSELTPSCSSRRRRQGCLEERQAVTGRCIRQKDNADESRRLGRIKI